MNDLQDKSYRPAVRKIGEYINNSVFTQFCAEIRKAYKCNEKIEYSSCSWERGWNIKLKKPVKHYAPYIRERAISQL